MDFCKDIFGSLEMVAWLFDPERGQYLEIEGAAPALLGLEGAAVRKRAELWQERIQPEDRALFRRLRTLHDNPGAGVYRTTEPEAWVLREETAVTEVDGRRLISGLTKRISGPSRRTDRPTRSPAVLQSSDKLLDDIIETAPLMIFVKEADDLRFVRFNRAGEALLGYSRDELLGKQDQDLFPEDQAAFFVAKDRVTLENRQRVEIPEEVISTRHGLRTLRTVKVPIAGEDGKPAYLLGISEDITERKRFEETRSQHAKELELQAAKLQESEKFLDDIIEHVPLVIWVKSAEDMTYLRFNRAGERLYGLSRLDMIGRTDHELFNRKRAERSLQTDQEAVQQRR
ncbi:MAG: PAS domain S-box protein, partial [Myxococcales bacterium]|nr:PAS domain S-box protein [Myxococcales bacterium]